MQYYKLNVYSMRDGITKHVLTHKHITNSQQVAEDSLIAAGAMHASCITYNVDLASSFLLETFSSGLSIGLGFYEPVGHGLQVKRIHFGALAKLRVDSPESSSTRPGTLSKLADCDQTSGCTVHTHACSRAQTTPGAHHRCDSPQL